MKEKIKAARRDKIIELIEDEEIKVKLQNGQILCEKCKIAITKSNIGSIKIENGKYIIICDRIDCIKDC